MAAKLFGINANSNIYSMKTEESDDPGIITLGDIICNGHCMGYSIIVNDALKHKWRGNYEEVLDVNGDWFQFDKSN